MNDQLNMNQQVPLKNSTAVLVLGILSILGCCFYGLPGLVMGIIALVLASKDQATYNTDPMSFTQGSLKNLKAGKVCAIIGVILSALMTVYFIFILIMFGTALFTGNPQDIIDAFEDLR